MYKYLVVVDQGPINYSAYSPHVPGCVSAGDSVEEALEHFYEALQMHFEGILEDGDPIPQIGSVASQFLYVEMPSVRASNTVLVQSEQSIA